MGQAQRITFVLDDLFTPASQAMSEEVLGFLLNALTALDVLYLRDHPETPLLYESGVVYQEEPPGAEDWANIPMQLKLGWGDCLPLDTLVEIYVDEHGNKSGANASHRKKIPLGEVCQGDVISGHDGPTTVLIGAATGIKPLLTFSLDNGRVLRCSPSHRLFLANGEDCRACDVQPGTALLSRNDRAVRVLRVESSPAQPCGDITTDTGRFYLPESDVVVHNCEDLACWRAAELQVRGVSARPGFTKQESDDGQTLYHIIVLLPDGREEDPSRQLGMR